MKDFWEAIRCCDAEPDYRFIVEFQVNGRPFGRLFFDDHQYLQFQCYEGAPDKTVPFNWLLTNANRFVEECISSGEISLNKRLTLERF